MANSYALKIECYSRVERVPITNEFMTINDLKKTVSKRFNIDYPFHLTYEGARLHGEDNVNDLSLCSNAPVRVRRSSSEEIAIEMSTKAEIHANTDIFLSYELYQQNVVQNLKNELEDRDYSLWLDTNQTSSNYQDISLNELGIRNSRIFICCITARYLRSTKSQNEFHCACKSNKPIIILLMEEMNWPPKLIKDLAPNTNYIEFFNSSSKNASSSWTEDQFNKLLSEIRAILPQY